MDILLLLISIFYYFSPLLVLEEEKYNDGFHTWASNEPVVVAFDSLIASSICVLSTNIESNPATWTEKFISDFRFRFFK